MWKKKFSDDNDKIELHREVTFEIYLLIAYGVASVIRIDIIIGLFCKRAL